MALCVMPRSRAISLHCINGNYLHWDDNRADNGEIWIKVRPHWPYCGRLRCVRPLKVKALMLTPVTVREVERNLLLWRTGRAALMNDRRTTRPMRMLTRLVESGYEVIASHVLTILGGPMERMADWEDKRRRPCFICFKYTFCMDYKDGSAILGSVENYRAIENSQCDFAYY